MYEENRRFLKEKSFSVHPPFNHGGTLLWSLWNSTKAQGPSWTFTGPKMDPKMDSARLILEDRP